MADASEVRQGRRRLEVLGLLKTASGSMTISEVAHRLGVHPNTARFHLEALVATGQAERVSAARKANGRPPFLFRAVRGMDPTGPRSYRLLAEVLMDALTAEPDPAARVVNAGRRWGRRYASAQPSETGQAPKSVDGDTARLQGLLDEFGFAPERHERGGERYLGLRNCPFLELASAGSGQVCRVHLGLMQGALAGWGAAVTVDRLDPFVEPELCLAHLTRAEPGEA